MAGWQRDPYLERLIMLATDSDNIAVADELAFPCEDEWRFRASDELRGLYVDRVAAWGLSPVTALLMIADYWRSWPEARRTDARALRIPRFTDTILK